MLLSPLSGVVHGALIVAITTAHTGIIFVKTHLAARAGVEAAAASDLAGIVCCRRNLVPLQCLESWILGEQCCRQDKVARGLAIHPRDTGHDKRLWNWLQVSGGLLRLLLVTQEDTLPLHGFLVQ